MATFIHHEFRPKAHPPLASLHYVPSSERSGQRARPSAPEEREGVEVVRLTGPGPDQEGCTGKRQAADDGLSGADGKGEHDIEALLLQYLSSV